MKPKVIWSYQIGPIYKSLDEAWLGGFEFAKALAISLVTDSTVQETLVNIGENPEVKHVIKQK